SASNLGLLLEGPLNKNKRGSWFANFRKSYLQYIINRIDFGDQPPVAFGFSDGQARVDYDLTPRHTITLNYLDGTSAVDRTRFRNSLGTNSLMTSGFRFTLLNFASRYTPTSRFFVTNHLAWSRENGHTSNRDNVNLLENAYREWSWHSDASYA